MLSTLKTYPGWALFCRMKGLHLQEGDANENLRVHLDSLEVLLRMAQMNNGAMASEIQAIKAEADMHFRRLEEREV